MKELRDISFKRVKKNFYKERKGKRFKEKYSGMFSLERPYIFSKARAYQETFIRRGELIMEGDLVLGAMVMGNELLFDPENESDCPAVFIYSYDSYFEENEDEIKRLAVELFYTRTLSEEKLAMNAAKKKIADMLNDEYTPQFNVELPKELTSGRTVFMTTLVVVREEIKNGVVSNKISYPLLVKEGIPSAIILDYKFYDSKIVKQKYREKRKKILMALVVLIAILSFKFKFNIVLGISVMVFLYLLL